MSDVKPEVLFYHLDHHPLERVLPNLLEKTIVRGWCAVVQSGSQERLEALDAALWTFSDDSFLPHGSSKDGNAGQQPVYLTTGNDTPNGAAVRFLVDGAEASDFSGFIRLVVLFDGHDAEAVTRARRQWQEAKAAGCVTTYWQQTEGGRWEKKA